MRNPDVSAAKNFFYEVWDQHCNRTLTPQAKHELKFLFRQTLAYAIIEGRATWDAAAQSYILPILQELATSVQNASEDPVTDAVVERESIRVIRKYQPGSGTPSWCEAYTLAPASCTSCSYLQAASDLFFTTFKRHCNKLDGAGDAQLDFIFKRTVRHALCVLCEDWDADYVGLRVAEFARKVQRSHHATVDDAKLHAMISDFIYEHQLPPEEFFVWCVDYPRADLEG
jgi:hypothetical protein